jgi:hypothetical protein
MANRRGKGESEPITLGQRLAEGCRFRPNRRAALMSPRRLTRPARAARRTRPLLPRRNRQTRATRPASVARSAPRPCGRLDPPATAPRVSRDPCPLCAHVTSRASWRAADIGASTVGREGRNAFHRRMLSVAGRGWRSFSCTYSNLIGKVAPNAALHGSADGFC